MALGVGTPLPRDTLQSGAWLASDGLIGINIVLHKPGVLETVLKTACEVEGVCTRILS